jgi:hypothetical protein
MVVVQKGFFGFERTLGGYHDPHLIQIRKFYQMVGNHQMADI